MRDRDREQCLVDTSEPPRIARRRLLSRSRWSSGFFSRSRRMIGSWRLVDDGGRLGCNRRQATVRAVARIRDCQPRRPGGARSWSMISVAVRRDRSTPPRSGRCSSFPGSGPVRRTLWSGCRRHALRVRAADEGSVGRIAFRALLSACDAGGGRPRLSNMASSVFQWARRAWSRSSSGTGLPRNEGSRERLEDVLLLMLPAPRWQYCPVRSPGGFKAPGALRLGPFHILIRRHPQPLRKSFRAPAQQLLWYCCCVSFLAPFASGTTRRGISVPGGLGLGLSLRLAGPFFRCRNPLRIGCRAASPRYARGKSVS